MLFDKRGLLGRGRTPLTATAASLAPAVAVAVAVACCCCLLLFAGLLLLLLLLWPAKRRLRLLRLLLDACSLAVAAAGPRAAAWRPLRGSSAWASSPPSAGSIFSGVGLPPRKPPVGRCAGS